MKLFSISLFLCIMAVALVLVPTASADAVAKDKDIHGVSYRDTATLKFALYTGSSLAFSNVDWYIYYEGSVNVYVDGEYHDTVTSNGLTIYTQTYDVGTRYIISFRCDDGAQYRFDINIRETITWRDFENEENFYTLSETELLFRDSKNVIYGALALSIATIVAVFYARIGTDQGDEPL